MFSRGLVTRTFSFMSTKPRFLSFSIPDYAPKAKAKAKAANAAASPTTTVKESDDIYNIFADKKDAILYPDIFYPKWLPNLVKPVETYGELSLMFVHGRDIENATYRQYRRFMRLNRKFRIKLNNLRMKKSKPPKDPQFWDI